MLLILMNQNFIWVCIGHHTSLPTPPPLSSLHVSINVGYLMVELLSFLDLPFHKHFYCICFHWLLYVLPHFTTKVWRLMLSGGVLTMVAVLLYNFWKTHVCIFMILHMFYVIWHVWTTLAWSFITEARFLESFSFMNPHRKMWLLSGFLLNQFFPHRCSG